jgi:hypothetical protein
MNTQLLPYHFERSANVGAPCDVVFDYLDDFAHFGEHMMRSSWMMAGSSMRYEFDEARGRTVGARIWLRGAFLGAPLEIEQQVTERVPPLSKSWQTTGQPRMLILKAYRMGFALSSKAGRCALRVYIDYAKPERGLGRWLGQVVAAPYARWCVRNALEGALRRFGQTPEGNVGDARGPALPH